MKKIMTIILLGMNAIMANAMSYDEARREALFLTDKMAYELNLNEQQYNDCYEINFDYLLGVITPDDIYGPALRYRNADLRHILFDWQYQLFAAAEYFFHPLRWIAGAWSYPIYRYYNTTHFFYSRPHVYISYRGGHDRFHHSYGFYASRRPEWRGGFRGHDRTPIYHRGYANHGDPHNPGGYRPSSHGSFRSENNRGYHIGGPETGRGNVGHSTYDNNRGSHSTYDNNRGSHSTYDNSTGRSGNVDHSAGRSGNDHNSADRPQGRRGYSIGTTQTASPVATTTSSQYTHPSSTRTIEDRANGSGRSSYGNAGRSSYGDANRSSYGDAGRSSHSGSARSYGGDTRSSHSYSGSRSSNSMSGVSRGGGSRSGGSFSGGSRGGGSYSGASHGGGRSSRGGR